MIAAVDRQRTRKRKKEGSSNTDIAGSSEHPEAMRQTMFFQFNLEHSSFDTDSNLILSLLNSAVLADLSLPV
ncbi:hypothetical protein EYF80_012969 [Liparis tanakae]|uniref:Uncharacterized protein n=1 Tax=Liparis tanakae TaxID=230148 RepID=A0A4Z2IFN5_9TELE|nr:hypothetical protein EYF80_012969 [Liparis tanakae]